MAIISAFLSFSGHVVRVSLPAFLLAFIYYFSFNSPLLNGQGVVSAVYKIVASSMLLTGVLAINRKSVRIVVLAVITLGYFVNAVHFHKFGGALSPGGLSSMLESNPEETREFLSLIPIRAVIQTGFYLLLGIYLLFRSQEDFRWKRGIPFLIMPVLLLPFIRRANSPKFWNEFNLNPLAVSANLYTGVPVLGEGLLTLGYYEQRARLDRLANTSKPSNVLELAEDTTPMRIVLVIGETASKDHFSSYGYGIPTTPFLDSLRQGNETIFFENAVSPSSISRESLVRVLSFATVGNRRPYTEDWNVIDLARKAGYKTVWLSNQWPYGSNESAVGAVAHLADETEYVQWSSEGPTFDTDLADSFDRLMTASPDEKLFIVVHFAGSHYRYDARSTDTDKAYIASTDSEYPEFDASIYQTDRALEGILTSLSSAGGESVLMFESDHGEEVGLNGHGFPQLSKVQVEVPLFIWSNLLADSYRDSYIPDRGSGYLLSVLSANRNRIFSTENTPFILARLMGWNLSTDGRRDMTLPSYDPGVPEILNVDNNIVRYDDDLPFSIGSASGSWLFGY